MQPAPTIINNNNYHNFNHFNNYLSMVPTAQTQPQGDAAHRNAHSAAAANSSQQFFNSGQASGGLMGNLNMLDSLRQQQLA